MILNTSFHLMQLIVKKIQLQIVNMLFKLCQTIIKLILSTYNLSPDKTGKTSLQLVHYVIFNME